MGFLDFAALLKGMSDEALNVKKERQAQENSAYDAMMKQIDYELSLPTARDEYKEQLLAAKQEIIMEHLGYGKPKGKGGNPLRKALEAQVGAMPNDYSGKMPQVGVGTGNAKTKVGGIGGGAVLPSQVPIGEHMPMAPPSPPSGMPSGPPQMASAQPQMPQGAPPAPPSRFYTPTEMGQRTGAQEAAKGQAEIDMKIAALQASPAWPMMDDVEKANAVYKIITGGSLEGSINPTAAQSWITVKDLQAIDPEIAKTVAFLKPEDKVDIYKDRRGKIVYALPHYEDPSKTTTSVPNLQPKDVTFKKGSPLYELSQQNEGHLTVDYNPDPKSKERFFFQGQNVTDQVLGDWQRPPSENIGLLAALRGIQLQEKTQTSPGQIINAATGTAAVVAPAEAEKVSSAIDLLQQSHVAEQLINDLDRIGSTGAIAGWIIREGVYVPVIQDKLTPTQAAAVSELYRLLNSYVYAVSGKQINEQEAERLGRTIPQITFSTETNRAILPNFKNYVDRSLKNYLRTNGWAIKGGITYDPKAAANEPGKGPPSPPTSMPTHTYDPKSGTVEPK